MNTFAAEEATKEIRKGFSSQLGADVESAALTLGAIAQATDTIKFGSTSTIISTLDPVRVYEDFATIDAISDGRVEIVAGRASRVGVFNMLGFSVDDYEELYDEKLELLKQINENEIVNWEGKFRAPLEDARVLPRAEREIPLWRAVGGAPPSAIAAGRDNIPMNLAALAGPVDAYVNTVDHYRQAAEAAGYDPDELPITLSGFFYTAETSQQAVRDAFPYIDNGMRLANGSGMSKRVIAQAQSMDSVFNVGDPDFLIEKILYQHERLGFQRYLGELDLGGMSFAQQMEQLEILGTKIAPALRKHTGK